MNDLNDTLKKNTTNFSHLFNVEVLSYIILER